MNKYLIIEALNYLDDDIIENHICRKKIMCGDINKEKHPMRVRRKLVCAGTLLILVVFLTGMYFVIFPKIELDNYVGNMSVKYVPNWFVKSNDNEMLPYYTETELFERADFVYSGTLKEIKQIKIDFDGIVVYNSLITIDVDKVYKGECPSKITVIAPPIRAFYDDPDSNLLYSIKKGDYGIFLSEQISEGKQMSENGCAFEISDICDATFIDGSRFGFIKRKNNTAECCDTLFPHNNSSDNVFTSLRDYTWDDVVTYVEQMLNTVKKGK